MISISDLLKLLDQVPVWRAIRALPERTAALEERVAALEKALGEKPAAVPKLLTCPLCGDRMKALREKDHPELGVVGVKVLELECPQCGNKTERQFDPEKGIS